MHQVIAFIVYHHCISSSQTQIQGDNYVYDIFLVTSGILTGSLVPACLLGRAAFMTQSQTAKGNVTVTNSKGMNVISSKDFKSKASVDVLNVVPGE